MQEGEHTSTIAATFALMASVTSLVECNITIYGQILECCERITLARRFRFGPFVKAMSPWPFSRFDAVSFGGGMTRGVGNVAWCGEKDCTEADEALRERSKGSIRDR